MLWRNPGAGRKRTRHIELYDYEERCYYQYNRTTMEQYQQKIWLDKVSKLTAHETSATNETLNRCVNRILDKNIKLNKLNNIFNFNTTKREDSYILDFIHGNSYLFGQCRKRIPQNNTSCWFCFSSADSAEHQILHCKKLIEQTHKNLLNILITPSHYREEILAPTRDDIQPIFIERVRFLIQQHDAIETEDN